MADSKWKNYRQENAESFLVNEKNFGTLYPSVMAFTKDNKSQAIWMDSQGTAVKIIQYDQSGEILKALDLINGNDITSNILLSNDLPKRDKMVDEFNSSLSSVYSQEYNREMKEEQKEAFKIPFNPETHFLSFSHDTYKVINLKNYKCENPYGPSFLQIGLENNMCRIEQDGSINDIMKKDVLQYLYEKRQQYQNLTIRNF